MSADSRTCGHAESAQCEYLCKNVDRAQELFELLCAQAADIWEVIEVFTHRNQFYICLERYEDLVHYGFECLATLGVSIERNPTPEMVDEARKKVYDLMGDRKVSDLVNIPPATDPRARVRPPTLLSPTSLRHRVRGLTPLSFSSSSLSSLPCLQGIQIVINKMCIGLFFVGNPNVLPLALCTAVTCPPLSTFPLPPSSSPGPVNTGNNETHTPTSSLSLKCADPDQHRARKRPLDRRRLCAVRVDCVQHAPTGARGGLRMGQAGPGPLREVRPAPAAA